MTKEKTTLILHLPNGKTETLELESVIFGGIIADGGFPCGGYHGDLRFDKSFIPMIHSMRAFIKICMEQNMNHEQAQMTLEYCLSEAVKKEEENDPLENIDLDTHMIKMKKQNLN